MVTFHSHSLGGRSFVFLIFYYTDTQFFGLRIKGINFKIWFYWTEQGYSDCDLFYISSLLLCLQCKNTNLISLVYKLDN